MVPRLPVLLATLALASALAPPVRAQDARAHAPVIIAVLVPDSAWPAGPLGRGLTFGGEEAALTARLLGREVELRLVDAGRGAAVAAELVELGAVAALSLLPAALTDSLAGRLAPAVLISLVSQPDSLPRSRALANMLHVLPPDSARQGTVAWHPGLERYGAGQLNQRYEARFQEPMSEAAWLAWFAVKAIAETALRAPPAAGASRLAAALRGPRAVFDGHKGAPLRFGEHGRLQQPLYRVDAAGRLQGEVPR